MDLSLLARTQRPPGSILLLQSVSCGECRPADQAELRACVYSSCTFLRVQGSPLSSSSLRDTRLHVQRLLARQRVGLVARIRPSIVPQVDGACLGASCVSTVRCRPAEAGQGGVPASELLCSPGNSARPGSLPHSRMLCRLRSAHAACRQSMAAGIAELNACRPAHAFIFPWLLAIAVEPGPRSSCTPVSAALLACCATPRHSQATQHSPLAPCAGPGAASRTDTLVSHKSRL